MAGRKPAPKKREVKSDSEDDDDDEDESSEDDDDDNDDESEEDSEEESEEEDSEEESEEEPVKKPSRGASAESKGNRKKSLIKQPQKASTSNERKNSKPTDEEFAKQSDLNAVKDTLRGLTEEKLPAMEQSLRDIKLLMDQINSKLNEKQDEDLTNTTTEPKRSEPDVEQKSPNDSSEVNQTNPNASLLHEVCATQKEHSRILETLVKFMEEYKEAHKPGGQPYQAGGTALQLTYPTSIHTTGNTKSGPLPLDLDPTDSVMNDLDEASRLLVCSKLIGLRKLSFAELIYHLNR